MFASERFSKLVQILNDPENRDKKFTSRQLAEKIANPQTRVEDWMSVIKTQISQISTTCGVLWMMGYVGRELIPDRYGQYYFYFVKEIPLIESLQGKVPSSYV